VKTPAGYAVEIRLAAIMPNGIRERWKTYTRHEIGDFDTQMMLVQCPCGKRYLIDVMALLEGSEVTVVEHGADPADTFGIKPDRLTGDPESGSSGNDNRP
jgi:hypothetical protein